MADWEGYRITLARTMKNIDENKAIHVSATENIKKTSKTIPEGKLKWMSPEFRGEICGRRKAERQYLSTITDNRKLTHLQNTDGKGKKADEIIGRVYGINK
jgi:hypothetical protein